MERIVHISVTQANPQSDLPYYHGKGIQENILKESGVPYTIIRPTLVFGREDILVNNIAWLLRRFPVFPIFGSGDYHLQPVFVGTWRRLPFNMRQVRQGSPSMPSVPKRLLSSNWSG